MRDCLYALMLFGGNLYNKKPSAIESCVFVSVQQFGLILYLIHSSKQPYETRNISLYHY